MKNKLVCDLKYVNDLIMLEIQDEVFNVLYYEQTIVVEKFSLIWMYVKISEVTYVLWTVLINMISDHAGFQRKWGGG